MINEHMLKTRLAEIQHYRTQVGKLHETLNNTQKALRDAEQSLAEVVEIPDRSVLVVGTQVFKFRRVGKVTSNGSICYINLEGHLPHERGGWSGDEATIYVREDNLTSIRIIQLPELDNVPSKS